MAVLDSLELTNSTVPLITNVANITLDCPPDVESWLPFYIVLSPVFLTGLVGNGVVLFVFLRHKDVRSAPNTLLFNLALADFITLLFCATAPVYDIVYHALPAICPVLRLIMELTMHGTGFTMVMLSIERYYAIARPFRSKTASAAFIRKAIIFIWLAGLTLGLVKFFLQTPGNCQKCVRMIDTRNMTPIYAVTGFIMCYIFPLAVITVFYILIARKLYFSDLSLKEQNETFKRQLQVRKRLALRVLLLVITYAVSFFPYEFFSLKFYLLEDLANAEKYIPLINILYCIGCTHISLNPFILYFLSKGFRTHFNNYLFCCFVKYTVLSSESNSNRQTRSSDKKASPRNLETFCCK